MKVTLSFKTPDVADQLEDLSDDKRKEVEDQLGKWISYGEYVNIDFDLANGTATVLESR